MHAVFLECESRKPRGNMSLGREKSHQRPIHGQVTIMDDGARSHWGPSEKPCGEHPGLSCVCDEVDCSRVANVPALPCPTCLQGTFPWMLGMLSCKEERDMCWRRDTAHLLQLQNSGGPWGFGVRHRQHQHWVI